MIYLAPALLLLGLLTAAVRLRHHIEPSCPSCTSRSWQDAAGSLDCTACGWSTAPRLAAELERQAA
jgi:hypothetical protein